MSVRKPEQPLGWAFGIAVAIVKPLLLLFTRHRWIDGTKIPATGGFVLVSNHLAHIDPLTVAHILYDHGRIPRYLAKAGLFRNRFLGFFLRSAGQIPVKRLTSDATGAYSAAVDAVRAGECVVVYPEGTITRDPALWPMVGKSGAARIALETGCPVVPLAHWGEQEILAPYTARPHLVPPRTVTIKVGDPVPLDDLASAPRSPEVTAQATARILAAITGLLADIREEEAPTERFDPRAAGVKLIGNPKSNRKKRRKGRNE